MAIKRADFESWLFQMDDRLAEFIDELPSDIGRQMDFSLDSLTILEGWLLEQYGSTDEILEASQMQRLDDIARYVGETLRKNLGGIWNIDLKNKRNVYYKIPVIEKQGAWTECPVSLVTAAMEDRSGSFIVGVLDFLSE